MDYVALVVGFVLGFLVSQSKYKKDVESYIKIKLGKQR